MRKRAMVGLGVIALVVATHPGMATDAATRGVDAVTSAASQLTGQAAPSASAAAESGPEQARHKGSGEYTMHDHDKRGRAAKWNPCQEIPVLVNPAHAPKGALKDLRQAIAKVNAASGLRFTIKGTTSATPRANWAVSEWSGAPGQWAPVLVSFVHTGQAGLNDPGAAGQASPAVMDGGGRKHIVSGLVVFNLDLLPTFHEGFGGPLAQGNLFMHEFGHMAGLGHVQTKSELMEPYLGDVRGLGPGDRAGLREMGEGGCRTTPAPPWA